MSEGNKLLCCFSSESKIQILHCLSSGPKTVTQIVDNCGVSQSAISQHLKTLKDLDVIDSEKKGKNQIYYLKQKDIAKIIKLIKSIS